MLLENYYYPAERSQHAGFVNDANRLYARYLTLARILATTTDLADNVSVQRELNRAQIRLKLLDAKHVLNPTPCGPFRLDRSPDVVSM